MLFISILLLLVQLSNLYGYWIRPYSIIRLYRQKEQLNGWKALRLDASNRGFQIHENRNPPNIDSSNDFQQLKAFIKNSQLIEYLSPKGTRNLALVYNRKKNTQYLELIGLLNHNQPFTIPINKVVSVIEGRYDFSTLQQIGRAMDNFPQDEVESVWKTFVERGETKISRTNLCKALIIGAGEELHEFDASNYYVLDQLMSKFGHIYFKQEPPAQSFASSNVRIFSSEQERLRDESSYYIARDKEEVRKGEQELSLLKEFRFRFVSVNALLNNPQMARRSKNSTIDVASNPSLNNDEESEAEDDIKFEEDASTKEEKQSGNAWSSESLSPRELAESLHLNSLPIAMKEIVEPYIPGLKELLFLCHPWTLQGYTPYSIPSSSIPEETSTPQKPSNHHQYSTPLQYFLQQPLQSTVIGGSDVKYDEILQSSNTTSNLFSQRQDAVVRTLKLMDFLDLSVNFKNLVRLLELLNIYPIELSHFIDRDVLQANENHLTTNGTEVFPPEVMEEAQYLINHHDIILDPDERLRVDLRHLENYAIDPISAQDIDDAISIEYLEDGREKLWVHVADVSRWIRPGSQLSIEAEKRMTSVYFPDEKISMFPERLVKQLLSLDSPLLSQDGGGSGVYVVSCGVILDNITGDVVSFEICPSRIRGVRRLTYIQLDNIIKMKGGETIRPENDNVIICQPNFANSTSTSSLDKVAVSTSFDSTPSSSAVNVGFSPPSLVQEEIEVMEDLLSVSSLEPAMTTLLSTSRCFDDHMVKDLQRLNFWANLRHKLRREQRGSIDDYLQDRTDFDINVKKLSKSSSLPLRSTRPKPLTSFTGKRIEQSLFPPTILLNSLSPASPLEEQDSNYLMVGQLSWCNATSHVTVSEYMLLMSDLIGKFSVEQNISVYFKTQACTPAITAEEIQLQSRSNETSFFRTFRLLKRLKAAKDSTRPGLHQTSGSNHYVQCTSPIRRYTDLYNHYRLKAAMHLASTGGGEISISQVREETGIRMLENMMTNEERIQRLFRMRLLSRQREQHWHFLYFLNFLLLSSISSSSSSTPSWASLQCVIVNHLSPQQALTHLSPYSKEMKLDLYVLQDAFLRGALILYDVVVLSFGTPHYYKLILPSNGSQRKPLESGEIVSCSLHLLQAPSIKKRVQQYLSSSATSIASSIVNYQVNAHQMVSSLSLLLPKDQDASAAISSSALSPLFYSSQAVLKM